MPGEAPLRRADAAEQPEDELYVPGTTTTQYAQGIRNTQEPSA